MRGYFDFSTSAPQDNRPLMTRAGGTFHSALLRWIVSRASGVDSEYARGAYFIHAIEGHHHNRCENSHRPTRQREYRMQGFKSAGHAQRFLSAYGPIAQHFRPRRHLWSAAEYRQEMKNRFESWAEITGTKQAA
jgi:hypothetical protein